MQAKMNAQKDSNGAELNGPDSTATDGESGLLGGAVAGVGILGSAVSFPERGGRWVENEEIHERVHGPRWQKLMEEKGLNPDYAERVFGFRRRYWTRAPGDAPSDAEIGVSELLHGACRGALEDAELSIRDIDLFIACTTTSSRYTTSQAAIVGGRLGYLGAGFEMKSGCSSAVHALTIAYRFLAGGARNVLIAAAETLTKVVEPGSRLMYAAGDGGGAMILGHVESEGRGLLASYLDSDGSHAGLMGVPGTMPPTERALENGEYFMRMSREADAIAREKWSRAPGRLYRATNTRAADIEAYVPHQVNRELVAYGARDAGLPDSVVVDCVGEYANTGSASLLIALDEARRRGRVLPESMVMLNAAGGGMAWGGLLLRA